MDETALAASSALESKEALIAPAFCFDFFFVGSAIPRGGDLALSEGGFHTVIGRAVSGGATTAAALERPFAFTIGLGEDSKVKTRGDDACSGSWAGEGVDAPNSEPQLGVTTPAPAPGQEEEGTHPNSEHQPGAAMPAPVLEQEKEETPQFLNLGRNRPVLFRGAWFFPLHTPGLPRRRPQMN